MMFALRSRDQVKNGCNQLFVDDDIFPQVFDVLVTRSEPFGIEIIRDNYDTYKFTGKEFGAIVQYPSASGHIRDYAAFAAAAHEAGAKVTAVCDLMSLVLLASPGQWGADIAVGSAQRFGLPMGFGGPTAGFMTTKGGLQAQHAGPYHRRIGGQAGEQGVANGTPDARAAHQTREGYVQYLYRIRPRGLHVGILCGLSRSRRAASDCAAYPFAYRSGSGRSAGTRLRSCGRGTISIPCR